MPDNKRVHLFRKQERGGAPNPRRFLFRLLFLARYSTQILAAPLDEFDCAHRLINIPLLLLLLSSPFFPAFSRKVSCHKIKPCSFSLSFAGKNLLIFALCNTRQITLFLCLTLCLSKSPNRLEVESLYFRFYASL